MQYTILKIELGILYQIIFGIDMLADRNIFSNTSCSNQPNTTISDDTSLAMQHARWMLP